MGRPSRYPDEFRREAVQMALASEDSRASAARRLGVNETTLRNWGVPLARWPFCEGLLRCRGLGARIASRTHRGREEVQIPGPGVVPHGPGARRSSPLATGASAPGASAGSSRPVPLRLIFSRDIYEWPVVGAGIAQLEECLGGWTAGSRRVERAYRVRRKKTSSPAALASVLASTSRSEPWCACCIRPVVASLSSGMRRATRAGPKKAPNAPTPVATGLSTHVGDVAACAQPRSRGPERSPPISQVSPSLWRLT
jgi:hypothetical protein